MHIAISNSNLRIGAAARLVPDDNRLTASTEVLRLNLLEEGRLRQVHTLLAAHALDAVALLKHR